MINSPYTDTRDKKNLKIARILIIVAFTTFILTFITLLISLIMDLNCRCDYDVCFCGLQTLIFDVFSLIPLSISAILATIGLVILIKLHKRKIQIPKWCIILAIISILQFLIYLILNQIFYLTALKP